MQPSAPPTAAPASAPTATDVVASIKKGQQAVSSLSKVGGGATDTELTPEALANMSEEQFTALFNELQNSGTGISCVLCLVRRAVLLIIL